MPYTVWGAFDAFRKNSVDISSDTSKRAKSSRSYLFDQLKGLNASDSACPKFYEFFSFGSFARRTKITPLDDIDLLATVSGAGTVPSQSPNNRYDYWLSITDSTMPLAKYNDGYGYVSSIRLLNQIKSSLGEVSNYKKADIKRNQQAVVLNLTSYTWNFDIVPAVAVISLFDSTTAHYLIPNGNGNWTRTDPRKDTVSINDVNGKHNIDIPAAIRLLKYWNRRTHKPKLISYYFETLCLKTFNNASSLSSFPEAITYFFNICPIYLDYPCYDPKGLGPNLDVGVTTDTKNKVKSAMSDAYQAATLANRYEAQNQPQLAIGAWKTVFGPDFPSYG